MNIITMTVIITIVLFLTLIISQIMKVNHPNNEKLKKADDVIIIITFLFLIIAGYLILVLEKAEEETTNNINMAVTLLETKKIPNDLKEKFEIKNNKIIVKDIKSEVFGYKGERIMKDFLYKYKYNIKYENNKFIISEK